MPGAVKLFFERYNVKEIERLGEEHFKEQKQIAPVIPARSPEEIQEIRLGEKEKYYAIREKFLNLAVFLAEKYPELYKEIKELL